MMTNHEFALSDLAARLAGTDATLTTATCCERVGWIINRSSMSGLTPRTCMSERTVTSCRKRS